MDYTLSVPTDPERNYGVLASIDNVLTLAHSYPMIPVYDEQGWHAEVPPQWGDLTFTDAAYFVVRVTAPADVTLIATGRQVSRDKTDKSQTTIFALGPGRDFMLTAAKGYEMQSQQAGETVVNSYAPVKFHENAGAAAKTASAALNIYSKRYAPYPYTEFDIVATPTLALGIEYPGLVAITDRIYGAGEKLGNAPVEIYLESTVAHETGHQWFYNLVGDDQLNQPWLDESLTQFITWQYFADSYGEKNAEMFKQSLDERWNRVDKAKISVGQPVAAYDGAQYSAIVYGRGALFFFALRDQMGQEKFDTFMKDYTQKFTWEIASTNTLEAQAEKDCACNLTSLFKEWITP
jgi:aminopeptidase N